MSIRMTRRSLVGGLLPRSSGNANIDIGVERRILNRFAFGPNSADLAEIRNTNFHAWLNAQLDPESIDDTAMETALAAYNSGTQPNDTTRFFREWTARCIFSKRQLLYRTVDFWENHFSTYFSKTGVLAETTENEAFKQNAFKSFRQMILTSARGPCMQKYLDNSSNVAQQPNENYAREIMELHTLGVSGGYTEPDVAEVARVFTGWTYETLNSGTPQASVRFKFNPSKHDHGPKTVMGWSTPGYTGDMGESEGEDLIKYLATHPATIRRMATKLCTYFVHEATPVRFRRKIESHLTNEQPMSVILGSLAEYVAGDNTTARLKTQDPAEFVVSTLRRLDIPFTTSLSTINNWITNLGKQLFYQHLPTGYAEEGAEWNGAGSQLKRWSFVHNLTNNLISGISVPWATLHGTGHTSATHRYNQAIDELVERLVDGELDSISRTNLRAFASTRMSYWSSPPTSLQELGLTRDLVGLILRLPEAATH